MSVDLMGVIILFGAFGAFFLVMFIIAALVPTSRKCPSCRRVFPTAEEMHDHFWYRHCL